MAKQSNDEVLIPVEAIEAFNEAVEQVAPQQK